MRGRGRGWREEFERTRMSTNDNISKAFQTSHYIRTHILSIIFENMVSIIRSQQCTWDQRIRRTLIDNTRVLFTHVVIVN